MDDRPGPPPEPLGIWQESDTILGQKCYETRDCGCRVDLIVHYVKNGYNGEKDRDKRKKTKYERRMEEGQKTCNGARKTKEGPVVSGTEE